MLSRDSFLAPACSRTTLDNFAMRQAILKLVRGNLESAVGTLLDIGCGSMPYRSLFLKPPGRVRCYIGLDLPASGTHPDLTWDGKQIPLQGECVDLCLATEVLEHVPEPEVLLREAWRVLKPGGRILLSVPFLWPLHCSPHDQYRYTPFALERHLRNAGFTILRMESHGGWDASLAQMLGLWVMHRPMSSRKRGLLSRAAVPLVKFLVRQDRVPHDFQEGLHMITGIAVTAAKISRFDAAGGAHN